LRHDSGAPGALLLEERHLGDGLPTGRLGRVQFGDLDDHTQRELAQLHGVVEDVVDHFLLLRRSQTAFLQHTHLDDLLDANQVVADRPETYVDVVRPADERLEVLAESATTFDGHIEVIVGDEDDRTLELEGPRQRRTVSIGHASLGTPHDAATFSGVARSLEKVKSVCVLEDGVAVIEDDDVTFVAILVESLVQAGRADETLADGRFLAAVVVVRHDLLDREGLAEAGRTRDDHRT